MNNNVREQIRAMIFDDQDVPSNEPGVQVTDPECGSPELMYRGWHERNYGIHAHAAWTCDRAADEARQILRYFGQLAGVEIPTQLLETVEPEKGRRDFDHYYHVQLVGPLGLAAIRASLSTDTTTVVEP